MKNFLRASALNSRVYDHVTTISLLTAVGATLFHKPGGDLEWLSLSVALTAATITVTLYFYRRFRSISAKKPRIKHQLNLQTHFANMQRVQTSMKESTDAMRHVYRVAPIVADRLYAGFIAEIGAHTKLYKHNERSRPKLVDESVFSSLVQVVGSDTESMGPKLTAAKHPVSVVANWPINDPSRPNESRHQMLHLDFLAPFALSDGIPSSFATGKAKPTNPKRSAISTDWMEEIMREPLDRHGLSAHTFASQMVDAS